MLILDFYRGPKLGVWADEESLLSLRWRGKKGGRRGKREIPLKFVSRWCLWCVEGGDLRGVLRLRCENFVRNKVYEVVFCAIIFR